MDGDGRLDSPRQELRLPRIAHLELEHLQVDHVIRLELSTHGVGVDLGVHVSLQKVFDVTCVDDLCRLLSLL